MLQPDTLEGYRQMTPGQRLQMTCEMIRENTPHLFLGTPDQVRRKFDLLRRENDERNRRILEAIDRIKEPL